MINPSASRQAWAMLLTEDAAPPSPLYSKLQAKIISLADAGLSNRMISSELGCGIRYVQTVRKITGE